MDNNLTSDQIRELKTSKALELVGANVSTFGKKEGVSTQSQFMLHLKFNCPLNKNTVNSRNIVVKRLNNTIQTFITYNAESNTVDIIPKRPYYAGAQYNIIISGRILSVNGRSLRKNLAISFEFDGATVIKLDQQEVGRKEPPPSRINPGNSIKMAIAFLLSGLVESGSFILGFTPGVWIGMIFISITVLSAMLESLSTVGQSMRLYKTGARLYNNNQYLNSISFFESALNLDPGNRQAQSGLDYAIDRLTKG